MARLRYNFQTGTLGASLTNSGTTITFAVAPSFATIVAPDYVAITLEPNAVGAVPGSAEIVHLTAYTAAATTGTIARGQEGTTAVTHNSGVNWLHGATALDAPGPSSSYDNTVLTGLSIAPVAYWKLNESVGASTAADSSGNGYTLTVHGTVTFGGASVVPTDSQTSAKGDGSSGYLTAAAAFALVPSGASSLTIIAATAPSVGSAGASIVLVGTDSGNGQDMRLGAGGVNFSALTYGDSSAPSAGYVDGKPHLIGAVVAGGGSKYACYVDGYSDGGNGGNGTLFNLTSAAPFLIGVTSFGQYSNFAVGRVAIFAGVLTSKDWRLLMQAFSGV